MKKQFAVAIAATFISGAALAAPAAGTIGVGVAHSEGTGDSSNTIFVPYTLNNGWWVEPFLSFSDSEDKNTNSDVTVFTIGGGVFNDFFTTPKTRAYAGGRLGYVHSEIDPPGPNNDNSDDGVSVGPVLGFGYEPVNNLLFGAEAFVTYEDSDINSSETFSTGTSLFVRYFFSK